MSEQQISTQALQALANHIKRYKAEKAARLLAEQRMQAAFGADVQVRPEDAKIIQPAMAVAGN